MARCTKCGSGVNSTYIREGQKGLWKKVGYYCPACDVYFDTNFLDYIESGCL